MPSESPVDLSIIIPAHNEAGVILAAIASVNEQQYSGTYEIIVACNGCSDHSSEVARSAGVKVVESDESGMSFGKNLGGRMAIGQLLLFLDADTRLLPGALAEIQACGQAAPNQEIVGTVQAFIDGPTLFERVVMRGVNWAQYRRELPTPSGAIFITSTVYDRIGGFNEMIPQGTSSEIVMRARSAGAQWRFLWKAKASTSPRRFRKVGMIKQLREWVENVRLMREENATDKLAERDYEAIR